MFVGTRLLSVVKYNDSSGGFQVQREKNSNKTCPKIIKITGNINS